MATSEWSQKYRADLESAIKDAITFDVEAVQDHATGEIWVDGIADAVKSVMQVLTERGLT